MQAFNGRYGDDFNCDDIEIPKNYKTLFHPQEETPQPWEYQLLKTIACYNYQVSEDATCNTELYKALKELERAIADHIIWRMPEMEAATWG